jgi:hypothetical protein
LRAGIEGCEGSLGYLRAVNLLPPARVANVPAEMQASATNQLCSLRMLRPKCWSKKFVQATRRSQGGPRPRRIRLGKEVGAHASALPPRRGGLAASSPPGVASTVRARVSSCCTSLEERTDCLPLLIPSSSARQWGSVEAASHPPPTTPACCFFASAEDASALERSSRTRCRVAEDRSSRSSAASSAENSSWGAGIDPLTASEGSSCRREEAAQPSTRRRKLQQVSLQLRRISARESPPSRSSHPLHPTKKPTNLSDLLIYGPQEGPEAGPCNTQRRRTLPHEASPGGTCVPVVLE